MTSSVRIVSAAINGLDAVPIDVEIDSSPGLHFFNIVGLPDKSVEESKDRIASALKNSGFTPPHQQHRRVIVNLAPAEIKKEGAGYDTPIALGYLLTTGQIQIKRSDFICIGELSLDGSLRRVNGVLPIACMAAEKKFARLLIPLENVGEATAIKEIEVIGIKNLKQLCDYLEAKITIEPSQHQFATTAPHSSLIDMSVIEGQEHAKRALVIAASGGHNILMSGPPGSGKSLLAQALPGIMPPLTHAEALEVTKIYSICGLTAGQTLIQERPFRTPHHTSSSAALIGGGSIPKPGEISLAHRGILFLDEFPEFPRNVLESLRQPLENGEVVVARARSAVKFPSRFLLVAAMNPCPCGNFGNPAKACQCGQGAVLRYQNRISGPLIDRLDILITVSSDRNTFSPKVNKSLESPQLRAIVSEARSIQNARFQDSSLHTNSEMGPQDIHRFCTIENSALTLFNTAIQRHALSMRASHKILKIARTIADLDSKEIINPGHIAEALSYRIGTQS